jgi:hypothetical protein
VREADGGWICDRCQARLEIPDGQPRTGICATSGQPNEYVLFVGGEEIHRCTDPADLADW